MCVMAAVSKYSRLRCQLNALRSHAGGGGGGTVIIIKLYFYKIMFVWLFLLDIVYCVLENPHFAM